MGISRLAIVLVLGLFTFTGCGNDALLRSNDPADSSEITRELIGTRLRLMAGNLSSGNGQDYNLGHGTRIFQGTRPDIALVQEFAYLDNKPEELRSWVDQAFGPEFSYARGISPQIPNGIVSRYPIVASGDWNDTLTTNREFTWAHIDIPGPVDLWAVSVHLLTTGSGNRQSEANQLVNYIRANVPQGDYVVIGGDFNVGSRSEAALGVFSAVAVTTGPYPVDRNGNGNTNAGRNKPYDWLIVSSGLSGLATPTILGSSTFPNGLIADTRVYSPIADIAPALTKDSSAPSMQHMGVVRDFDLPNTTPVPSVRLISPNGGEVFQGGSAQVIRWTASNVSTVDLAFAADGITYSAVFANVTASAGSVNWTVPANATSAAKIRVSSASVSDSSDAPFTIQAVPARSVTVTFPNGAETLTSGSTQTITWTSANIANIDIAYSGDGLTYTSVASNVSALLGGFVWTVPSASTTTGFVRVNDASDSAMMDVSDGAFSVVNVPVPRSVRVESPNGGELYASGTTQTVRWSATNVSIVDIAYAADGVVFSRIASGIPANTGSIDWLIPAGATSAGRIRVTDSPDALVSDISDSAFTVSEGTQAAQVIINEVLANEPGSDTAGEFVELVNLGTESADISRWTVSDSVSVRHTFASGTMLAAWASIVVFGNVSAAPPGIGALTASTGTLGFSNSGDSVKLGNASGGVVDSVIYTSTFSSTDGVSFNRSPDRTAGAPFVLHNVLSSSPSSPGRRVDGSL